MSSLSKSNDLVTIEEIISKAKEYIDKVFIIKNEKVELLPMYNEWKELVPKEWLEV